MTFEPGSFAIAGGKAGVQEDMSFKQNSGALARNMDQSFRNAQASYDGPPGHNSYSGTNPNDRNSVNDD